MRSARGGRSRRTERATKERSPSPTVTPEECVSIPDDLLSEESDFYGDTETKALCNKRADRYNPQRYWAVHEWNAQVIAGKNKNAANLAVKKRAQEGEGKDNEYAKKIKLEEVGENLHANRQDSDGSTQNEADEMDLDNLPLLSSSKSVEKATETRKPVNYYEGIETAKQLSETVSQFLSRVPPSTTPLSQGPWIWIANPFPPTSSNPEGGDIGGFKQLGFNLLQRYLTRKAEVENKNPGKPPATITRMLRTDRLKLEPDIVALAREKHVMNGKWMLFPTPNEVDRVWRVVAQATWEGKLGTSAKVATNAEGQEASERAAQRLICIYTCDFSDEADVKRVLLAMRDLKLLDDDDNPDVLKTVYYKCDAYTYLDIASGNEFKLKASMYNSRDVLKNE